jgi:excisionase family DNA binding protein
MSRLVRVDEAAARLGLKVSTVRPMISKGDLPAVRPTRNAVRVREDDLGALIRFSHRPQVQGRRGGA